MGFPRSIPISHQEPCSFFSDSKKVRDFPLTECRYHKMDFTKIQETIKHNKSSGES